MELSEAEQAAAIFTEAGWQANPRNGWGGRFVGPDGVTLAGVDPWGTPRSTGVVANPEEGPTNVIDAAHWLIEHAKQRRLAVEENNLSTEATLEPPQVDALAEADPFERAAHGDPVAPAPPSEHDGSHESDGETGEAVGAEEGATADLSDGAGELSADDPLDADFFEPSTELDAAELGEEILEEHPEEFGTGPQFIFGDNLDQMRTAAIGLVMRYARSLMPAWEVTDDARLVELRNFVMGVSESRWPDDAAKQQELAGLEATLSRIGAIVKTRDAKVEFLETATREEIEAFVPEAGWP